MEAGTRSSTARWDNLTETAFSVLTVGLKLSYRPSKTKITGTFQDFVRDNYAQSITELKSHSAIENV